MFLHIGEDALPLLKLMETRLVGFCFFYQSTTLTHKFVKE
jgi:hypothetical protein